MALSPELRGVNSYLRDVNAERADRLFKAPAGRRAAAGGIGPRKRPHAPSSRSSGRPGSRHDPKGAFCVSFRGVTDRAGSARVHRAQTAHDLVRFLRDGLRFPVLIDRIWEDELATPAGWMYAGWYCKDCDQEIKDADLVIVNEDADMTEDGWQDLTTVAHGKVCPPED
jgi:hypothetical protein